MCDSNTIKKYTLYEMQLGGNTVYFCSINGYKSTGRTALKKTVKEAIAELGMVLPMPSSSKRLILAHFDDPKEVKEKYPDEFI